jgi:hypothetical protein
MLRLVSISGLKLRGCASLVKQHPKVLRLFFDKPAKSMDVLHVLLVHPACAQLLAADPDATDAEAQFEKAVAKYDGTVTGGVLRQEMKEILDNIRGGESEDLAYAMLRLSDQYRSGFLKDDEKHTGECKWLLASARLGYSPALDALADYMTVGSFYFEKDPVAAAALRQINAG